MCEKSSFANGGESKTNKGNKRGDKRLETRAIERKNERARESPMSLRRLKSPRPRAAVVIVVVAVFVWVLGADFPLSSHSPLLMTSPSNQQQLSLSLSVLFVFVVCSFLSFFFTNVDPSSGVCGYSPFRFADWRHDRRAQSLLVVGIPINGL